MEHSEYRELLALEALDALNPSDAGAMRAHLESCAQCRSELAEIRDAAALLAHAAPPAAPSEDVRERILDRIKTTSTSSSSQAPKVLPLRAPSSKVWATALRLAAAIAVVMLLLGIIVLWRRDVASRREIRTLAHQVDRQQRELQVERENLARQDEALALMNSPEAKKMALSGTPAAQTARATFVYDQKSGHGMLMVDELPATPADKAYEVWFIPKGLAPIPGRTFTVDRGGRALIADNLPSQAKAPLVIAITLEPKSGSAAPTGTIYLASPAS